MKRLWLSSAVLVLGVVLGQAAASPTLMPNAASVTVFHAAIGKMTETVSLTGTLVPREEVLVSARTEGVAITQILAEEGDVVRVGQVLARLSRETLVTLLAQNTAQLARQAAAIAEAQATQAEAEAAFRRTRNLMELAVASREMFDTRQATAETAAARVASARADLRFTQAQRQELAVRLAETEITAPVAGIVSRRAARLGAIVSMSGDPLFRIIDHGVIELEAEVPDNVIAKLRPGEPAEVDISGGILRHGTVRLVSPEINQVTRLGRVRITLEPGAGSLVLGSFGRAAVQTLSHESVFVPLSAVQFDPDGPHVQLVRNGIVHSAPVTVGMRDEDRAEITQGLGAGEEVVATSGTFLRDGDRVNAIGADLTETPIRAAADMRAVHAKGG